MKKPSNQKGMAPIVVVIILAVLVIAGAVGWFVFVNNEGEDETGSSSETTSETEETRDLAFSGNYFDAVDRGQPLHCQWTAAQEAGGEQQASEGQFYTDGESRGYSVASFEADGTTTTAYSVFDAEYIYSWTNVPGAGVSGFKFPVTESDDDLSEAEQQQALDVHADYSFDCESWNVDESLLTPPRDVTFTEINVPSTP